MFKLELLQHHLIFDPEELKSRQENDTKRFRFMQTLWPLDKVKVSESGMKW